MLTRIFGDKYRDAKMQFSRSVTENYLPYVTNSRFESVKHEDVLRALINH